MSDVVSVKDQKSAAWKRLTEVARRRNALISEFAAALTELDEAETVPAIVAASKPPYRPGGSSGYADQLVPQAAIASAFFNPDTEGMVVELSVYQIRKLVAAAKAQESAAPDAAHSR